MYRRYFIRSGFRAPAHVLRPFVTAPVAAIAPLKMSRQQWPSGQTSGTAIADAIGQASCPGCSGRLQELPAPRKQWWRRIFSWASRCTRHYRCVHCGHQYELRQQHGNVLVWRSLPDGEAA